MRCWQSNIAFTNWDHACRMAAVSVDRLQHDVGALEASASRAGLALACSYSTAAEFEAELIRERRAAGAYARPRAGQWRALLTATVAASLAALLLLIR
jgi:DNA invertase Pin-like site-specific DNA recombinase